MPRSGYTRIRPAPGRGGRGTLSSGRAHRPGDSRRVRDFLSTLSILVAATLLSACNASNGAGQDRASDGVQEDSFVAEAAYFPRARAADSPSVIADTLTPGASRRTAIVLAAERVGPAVVTVNVLRTERIQARSAWESFFLPPGGARRTSGLGSGFIIDSSGFVLTNDHVVRGAERMMVTLPDGRDLEAELVGTDEVTDVAVLRVRGSDLPTVPLGTSEGLLIGEWVVAIGNPFGHLISNPEPSVSAGVVSALNRHIVPTGQDRGFYLGMIQTDASVNPGNSGGPLVNALGEVIGMNSSIFTRSGGSEGLSFAIPIDRALRIAEDLIRHGVVRRAWTGLEVEGVEADDWGRTRGVRAGRVAPGSPAARAGLTAGGHLVEANGRRLATPLDFEAVLLDLRAGDPLELVLSDRSAPVVLTTEGLPSLGAERVTIFQDLQLITVTPGVRSERGIQSEHGAVVVGISNSLAANLGLRVGDVIFQINNSPVREAADAAAILGRVGDRGAVRIYFERSGSVGVRDFYLRR